MSRYKVLSSEILETGPKSKTYQPVFVEADYFVHLGTYSSGVAFYNRVGRRDNPKKDSPVAFIKSVQSVTLADD